MSVVGFDFGSFNSYAALVRTGGIETVDNEYSYRATPTSVSFTDLMRFSGNSAKSQMITNCNNTFSYFKNLIGLKFDDPLAAIEMKYIHCPLLKLSDGYIGVEATYLGKKTVFSITQLVAIMLSDLRATVLSHVPKFPDCVFNVPVFFKESQRRAFLDACKVADVTPIAIINDTAAVCLNYCLFKTELPADDQPPRNVAFVNVGYSSTQVCIASFNKGKFSVLSSVGSTNIGGRSIDMVLCQAFAKEFRDKHKIDVFENRKAFSKLIAECESLKKQMNTTTLEMPIKIECFVNELDLISKTCRADMDNLNTSIYDSLKQLIDLAITNSGIDVASIHSVEAIGGSSRLIGIKNVINIAFNRDSFTTLNGDEAVAKGCAIQCALLSPVVRLREIQIKDYLPFSYKILYINLKGEKKEVEVFKVRDVVPATREVSFPPIDNFYFDMVSVDSNSQVITHVSSCRIVGKMPTDYVPEKLIFNIRLDLSNIAAVTRAYFLEVKKEEGQKLADDNPPQADKPTDSVSKDAAGCQGKTLRVNHDVAFEYKYMDSQSHNIEVWRSIELDMIEQVKIERARSSSKNALEEYIYSTRDKLDATLSGYMTPEEASAIQTSLARDEDWLYGDGEFDNTEVYQKRLSDLQNLLLPVTSRFDGFLKASASLEKLSVTVAKYRKFINVYNESQSKYKHVSIEEYTEYFEKVKQADTFMNETYGILNNQPKTSLPKVTSYEIETKTTELCIVCDKIIKKAENPPKVAPPPAEASPAPSTKEQPKVDATDQVPPQDVPQA